MFRLTKFISLFFLTVIVSSCYKDGSLRIDATDSTWTYYDNTFDFNSYTTFSLPDSTILKSNFMKKEEIEKFYQEGGTSDKTLEELHQRFTDLGYSYQENDTEVDFYVVPTMLMVHTTGAIWYPPGWWWGYPGFGWSGWWGYPGYPWHPGYVQYYSYKTGTVVFEIIDGESYREMLDWIINNPQPTQTTNNTPDLTFRWMATIDGYLSSTADLNADRAMRGVDEAFSQSPYLRKK